VSKESWVSFEGEDGEARAANGDDFSTEFGLTPEGERAHKLEMRQALEVRGLTPPSWTRMNRDRNGSLLDELIETLAAVPPSKLKNDAAWIEHEVRLVRAAMLHVLDDSTTVELLAKTDADLPLLAQRLDTVVAIANSMSASATRPTRLLLRKGPPVIARHVTRLVRDVASGAGRKSAAGAA
jgi:hypothetical protein